MKLVLLVCLIPDAPVLLLDTFFMIDFVIAINYRLEGNYNTVSICCASPSHTFESHARAAKSEAIRRAGVC